MQQKNVKHFSLLMLAAGWAAGCHGAVQADSEDVVATPEDEADESADPEGTAPTTPSPEGSDIEGAGPTASVTPPDSPGQAPAMATCDDGQVAAGPTKLRRLQPAEYQNTARALLGDDGLVVQLEAQAGAIVSALEVDKLAGAAHTLAVTGKHERFAPCEVTGEPNVACARGFIEDFGKWAFRRPLEPEEQTWLQDVYERLMTQTVDPPFTFREGITALAEVILQAPQHYYLQERGVADAALPSGIRRLTGYERAARLSYLMWSSMPDAELFEAADVGALDDAVGVRQQAERLLEAPAAHDMVRRFASAWLRLDASPKHPALEKLSKDPDKFDLDSPELRRAMRTESEHLYERAFFDRGGFHSLLTSTEAYVDSRLARLYGVDGPTQPDVAEWVELPSEQRAGIFTRAAFLTSFAGAEYQSPILRGVQLFRNVLCQPLPDPPATADNTPPSPRSASTPHTVRELSELKTHTDACISCHQIVNPLGFALENYDALGQWQTQETGTLDGEEFVLAVNSQADVAAGDVRGEMSGGVQLSQALASSLMAQDCMVDTWFEKALTRAPIAEEACELEQLKTRFREDGDLRDLVLNISTSDSALYIREDQP